MCKAETGLTSLLGFMMSLFHFLGEELEEHISGYKEQAVSFTAGVSITYIFLQLIPEFHRIALDSSELIFAFPLLGFSSIHLIEKYIQKSSLEQEAVWKDYGEIHSVFLFIYHGAIGYLTASLLAENTVSGLLFFLPLLLHIAVSSFSVSELHRSIARNRSVKLLISLAPLAGITLQNLGFVAEHYFHAVFGVVTGIFFYVVIRDSMPSNDRGCPREYVVGTAVYLAVIVMAKTI